MPPRTRPPRRARPCSLFHNCGGFVNHLHTASSCCNISPRASGLGSVGRAQPCQGWGRGFESRSPLQCHFKSRPAQAGRLFSSARRLSLQPAYTPASAINLHGTEQACASRRPTNILKRKGRAASALAPATRPRWSADSHSLANFSSLAGRLSPVNSDSSAARLAPVGSESPISPSRRPNSARRLPVSRGPAPACRPALARQPAPTLRRPAQARQPASLASPRSLAGLLHPLAFTRR